MFSLFFIGKLTITKLTGHCIACFVLFLFEKKTVNTVLVLIYTNSIIVFVFVILILGIDTSMLSKCNKQVYKIKKYTLLYVNQHRKVSCFRHLFYLFSFFLLTPRKDRLCLKVFYVFFLKHVKGIDK